MPALIMIVSAAAIIFFVKYGLLRGIDHVANALNWTPKTRGQVTGYATSVPELVCLVAAGLAGVWEAGLWNIASSNIINATLMLAAVLYFRQFGELFNRRFRDELAFAGLAVVIPIALMYGGWDKQWYLVPCLLGFFVFYKFVDKRLNQPNKDEHDETTGNLPMGMILGITALIAIIVAGIFLGDATKMVVEKLGVNPVLTGWILGVVTSIPEMVSFFAVYSASRREGNLHELNDTQEALDNLTGSNMANVGIVYPLGLLAFLVGTSLLAG